MLGTAIDLSLGILTLAFVLTAWRLLRGPDVADRVLAIDTLYIKTVALVILLGLRLESALLFEAALVIAMLGFIATVALARFLVRAERRGIMGLGGGRARGRRLGGGRHHGQGGKAWDETMLHQHRGFPPSGMHNVRRRRSAPGYAGAARP